jgi:hypothetical protein
MLFGNFNILEQGFDIEASTMISLIVAMTTYRYDRFCFVNMKAQMHALLMLPHPLQRCLSSWTQRSMSLPSSLLYLPVF